MRPPKISPRSAARRRDGDARSPRPPGLGLGPAGQRSPTVTAATAVIGFDGPAPLRPTWAWARCRSWFATSRRRRSAGCDPAWTAWVPPPRTAGHPRRSGRDGGDGDGRLNGRGVDRGQGSRRGPTRRWRRRHALLAMPTAPGWPARPRRPARRPGSSCRPWHKVGSSARACTGTRHGKIIIILSAWWSKWYFFWSRPGP